MYHIYDSEVIAISSSRLYNLEPIGQQTEMVEGLSSYLIRLAEAHSVTLGVLVSKKIAPAQNKQYLLKSASEGGNGFYNAGHELNGLGNLAEDWAQTLNILTERNDLENLTLVRLNEWLPDRGVLRTNLAWCPACLEEWKMSQSEIYEPLLWNFQSVTHCINHKTLLTTECPNCKKMIQILSRKRRIGYCPNCCAWLGSLVAATNDVNELDC